MWRPSEVRDGTYNLDDLADAHEALDLMAENAYRQKLAMDAEKARGS